MTPFDIIMAFVVVLVVVLVISNGDESIKERVGRRGKYGGNVRSQILN